MKVTVICFLFYSRYTMAVAGLVAGGVTVFIVPILLCIFGFTMCGVRILSCAACWQSSVGDVESGSCFSCLQSVAANWCQCKSIGVFLLLGLVVGVTTGMVLLVKTDVKYFDMDHAMTSGAESQGIIIIIQLCWYSAIFCFQVTFQLSVLLFYCLLQFSATNFSASPFIDD